MELQLICRYSAVGFIISYCHSKQLAKIEPNDVGSFQQDTLHSKSQWWSSSPVASLAIKSSAISSFNKLFHSGAHWLQILISDSRKIAKLIIIIIIAKIILPSKNHQNHNSMHMHVNIVIIIIINILQINFVFINDDSSYLNNVHLSEREKVEVPCVRKAKGLWPLSRGAPQRILKMFS